MRLAYNGSMTVRIFLILIGGAIVSAALVMTLATYERKNLEIRMRTHHMSERAEQSIHMLDAIPAADRPNLIKILNRPGIRVILSPTSVPQGHLPDAQLYKALHDILGNKNISVLERADSDCPVPAFGGLLDTHGVRHCVTLLTTLNDGTPIQIDLTQRDRFPPLLRGNFLKNLLLFLLGLSLVALIVAHMATQPLRRLAKAAHALGHNIEQDPLPADTGCSELREAAMAFNTMQTSIRNHIEERTYILAAIAHDLQTPLTRLRLRLEKIADNNLRASLVADLTATLSMVTEGLEFARMVSFDEQMERVDLDSLVEALCNDAIDAGCDVTFSGRIGKPVPAFPHALRRCVSNLLDNALKYGNFAHVMLEIKNGKAVIAIIDGGAGLPDNQLETVFQPFKRMEHSRSRQTGGTGLGLTIARIIAEKHRGSIHLKNAGATDLGLIAIIELQLA